MIFTKSISTDFGDQFLRPQFLFVFKKDLQENINIIKNMISSEIYKE